MRMHLENRMVLSLLHTRVSCMLRFLFRCVLSKSLTNDIHEHNQSAAENWSTNPWHVAGHAVYYLSPVNLHVKYTDCSMFSVFVSIREMQVERPAESRGPLISSYILFLDDH